VHIIFKIRKWQHTYWRFSWNSI